MGMEERSIPLVSSVIVESKFWFPLLSVILRSVYYVTNVVSYHCVGASMYNFPA